MFGTTLAFALAIFLTACGSIDIEPNSYPIYSGPQNPPGTPTGARVEPNWSGSAPGESGDPTNPGAQPSMGELGSADTDGGTTDGEPPFHPTDYLQPQAPGPYHQEKNLAWEEQEFEPEYEWHEEDPFEEGSHQGLDGSEPEEGPYWEGDEAVEAWPEEDGL